MTKNELNNAKSALIAAGWTFVCATLAGANGGLRFVRRVDGVKEEFTLNKFTIANVADYCDVSI